MIQCDICNKQKEITQTKQIQQYHICKTCINRNPTLLAMQTTIKALQEKINNIIEGK